MYLIHGGTILLARVIYMLRVVRLVGVGSNVRTRDGDGQQAQVAVRGRAAFRSSASVSSTMKLIGAPPIGREYEERARTSLPARSRHGYYCGIVVVTSLT